MRLSCADSMARQYRQCVSVILGNPLQRQFSTKWKKSAQGSKESHQVDEDAKDHHGNLAQGQDGQKRSEGATFLRGN